MPATVPPARSPQWSCAAAHIHGSRVEVGDARTNEAPKTIARVASWSVVARMSEVAKMSEVASWSEVAIGIGSGRYPGPCSSRSRCSRLGSRRLSHRPRCSIGLRGSSYGRIVLLGSGMVLLPGKVGWVGLLVPLRDAVTAYGVVGGTLCLDRPCCASVVVWASTCFYCDCPQ